MKSPQGLIPIEEGLKQKLKTRNVSVTYPQGLIPIEEGLKLSPEHFPDYWYFPQGLIPIEEGLKRKNKQQMATLSKDLKGLFQ